MKKALIIALVVAIALVVGVYALILAPLMTTASQLDQTVAIEITDNVSGQMWTVTDSTVINEIIKQVQKREETRTEEINSVNLEFTLIFVTQQLKYGPLDCYTEPQIAVYRNNDATMIKTNDKFLNQIRSTRP